FAQGQGGVAAVRVGGDGGEGQHLPQGDRIHVQDTVRRCCRGDDLHRCLGGAGGCDRVGGEGVPGGAGDGVGGAGGRAEVIVVGVVPADAGGDRRPGACVRVDDEAAPPVDACRDGEACRPDDGCGGGGGGDGERVG